MMQTIIFTLILLVTSFLQVHGQNQGQCCEEYCFTKDNARPQTRRFSTKTAYELIKGAEYGTQYTVPNCKASKIWILSRHGTRLPSAKEIGKLDQLEKLRARIIENYEIRRTKPDVGALCAEDLANLKKWSYDRNITADHGDYLTVQGWNDLKFLAKNYQRIFPDILEYQYSPEKFLFRHTDTQRTEASYKGFVEGLFGDDAYNNIRLPPVPRNDTLLRPYDNCPLWVDQDNNKNNPDSEISKFKMSDILNKTIGDISTRLGFKFPLETKQVELMWDMCRYEQAWYLDQDSAWCLAFTPSEVEVFEYMEDLKYYYKSGYGSELNPKLSCEVAQDMMKHLQSKSQPQAIAYFTHSAAIQLFLTALGISKDAEPLKSDNYWHMSKRLWRTSALGPFAANFAAIKYDCNDDPQESSKIIFFLNQNPVNLHWCRVGLCNWNDVMNYFGHFIDEDCANTFCSTGSGNTIKVSFGILLFTLVLNIFSF